MDSGPRIASRFIPTRVGNTAPVVRQQGDHSVHPHACGEYMGKDQRTSDEGGSSPRVWGIPVGHDTAAPALRFIPTRVGNTF